MGRARLEKRRVSANHLFYLSQLSANLKPGEFESIFRGEGTQFMGLRPYEPGDDLRHVDWAESSSSYFTTGELMVQEKMERKKPSVIFVVDVSLSEVIGKQESKSLQNRFFVELLTDYCLAEGAEVGFILFSSKVHKFYRPPNSEREIEKALSGLSNLKKGSKTNIKPPLRGLMGYRKPSVVFLISDFISELNWQKAMSNCRQIHEVVLIVITNELDFSKNKSPGIMNVRGIESGKNRFTDFHRETNYVHRLMDYFTEAGLNAHFVGKGGNEEAWFNRLMKIFDRMREEGRK